jgi:hypothetical protein
MWWSVVAAIIAVAAAVAVAYTTNFMGEDFRRFRDGSALAAALAGELRAHGEALPTLRVGLEALIRMAELGLKPELPSIDTPNDPVFEQGVGRLGLLGVELAQDVVFVYQTMRAFRLLMKVVATDQADMSTERLVRYYRECMQAIERAAQRAEPLVLELQRRAEEKTYKPMWPWQLWRG